MDLPQESLDVLADEWASIKKRAFKETVGTVFGIAILSVLARAVIRLKTWKRLSKDDYLLFIAAGFLAGSTGQVYHICDAFYITAALQKEPSLLYRPDVLQAVQYMDNVNQDFVIYLVISWTAIFSVKLSFLAFFKQLIRQVNRIQYYYWAVVAFTVVSWIFLISEPFILCPKFGAKSVECFDPSKNLFYVSMTGLVTGVDALSDILIASIPIIVLHRARIRNIQKISLGLFLCLSLVMVCFAIVRVSKIHGAAGVDVPWEFFWMFMESSVAVIMGSLTVFRSLLSLPTKSSDDRRRDRGGVIGLRTHEHFSHRMRFLRLKKEHIDLESQSGLPDVPSATMTGIRTFIRRNNLDPTLTDVSQQKTLTENDEAHQLITHDPHSLEGSAERRGM